MGRDACFAGNTLSLYQSVLVMYRMLVMDINDCMYEVSHTHVVMIYVTYVLDRGGYMCIHSDAGASSLSCGQSNNSKCE